MTFTTDIAVIPTGLSRDMLEVDMKNLYAEYRDNAEFVPPPYVVLKELGIIGIKKFSAAAVNLLNVANATKPFKIIFDGYSVCENGEFGIFGRALNTPEIQKLHQRIVKLMDINRLTDGIDRSCNELANYRPHITFVFPPIDKSLWADIKKRCSNAYFHRIVPVDELSVFRHPNYLESDSENLKSEKPTVISYELSSDAYKTEPEVE